MEKSLTIVRTRIPPYGRHRHEHCWARKRETTQYNTPKLNQPKPNRTALGRLVTIYGHCT